MQYLPARRALAWTELANGYCSPTGTYINETYNFGSGQGKDGCKDECDQTSTCNFVIYNSATGVCSMSSHEVAPTDCNKEEKFWSLWKPPSQAAPALPEGATTTTTTPLKDEDAPVFLAPSTTLPLFFETTVTPYQPPENSTGGWKLERVADATVPDYAGKPPSGKPGEQEPVDPDGGRGSPYTGMVAHDMGPVAPEEPPSTSPPDILEAEPAPDMGPVAPEDPTTGPEDPLLSRQGPADGAFRPAPLPSMSGPPGQLQRGGPPDGTRAVVR